MLSRSLVILVVGSPTVLATPNVTSLIAESLVGTTHCSARGGCDCKCDWASPSTCGGDDGSCCYACCCGRSPGPSPSGDAAKYCPDPASDFAADYGSPQWSSSGFTIHGAARASSKASFNLAGGFIEFDMDLGGAHGNVNNNVYVTFPNSVGNYCDSGPAGGCAELDFVENNGNCAAATTFHTDPNGGDKGGKQTVNGISSNVHVKAEWDASGDTLTVHVNGHTISGAGNPGNEMKSRGAVIYSSQWTGWVPGNCGGDGNLGASTFSVSNLRIQGSVVQGSPPRLCAPGPSTPAPTSPGPSPTPTPTTPSGTGQCCFGGCGTSCQGGWCGQSEDHCTGNCKGMWCPSKLGTSLSTVDLVV